MTDVFGRLISNGIAALSLWPSSLRCRFLRMSGTKIGHGTVIFPGCIFKRPNIVNIGSGTFVGFNCVFEGDGAITLGNNCNIATGVHFVTTQHEIGPEKRRAGSMTQRTIAIGDGTWIGANVVILPGITIGQGCVIGAGAVVTKNCNANSVYAGVPARRVRQIDRD